MAATVLRGDVLLTTADVATLLHVHPCTVRRYRASGRLPTVRLGAAVRIPLSAVRNLIDDCTVGGER